jgi:hypothetical protein
MTEQKELRSAIRESIDFELIFAKKWSEEGPDRKTQWPGQALDICKNGLGFKTPIPLVQGEVLRVKLPVSTIGIPIPVFSEVRWVMPEGDGYRVGIQFLI